MSMDRGRQSLRTWIQAQILLCALSTAAAAAQDANVVGRAFAGHCFSPYLTAQTAMETLAHSGARVDFYDLRPFSSATPSPVMGRPVTTGTDRRCEVAYDGADHETAKKWMTTGLQQEQLTDQQIAVPEDFPLYHGTKHAAAVQLNPNRIAVTQIGIRPGPNGVETYLNVERLLPLDKDGS